MADNRVYHTYASWSWANVGTGKALPMTPEQRREKTEAAYWATRDVVTER